MGPVAVDTLLLHHEAYIVNGSGIDEVVALDVGYKGRLELGRQTEEHGHWSHILRGYTMDA
jgi:hypothetical protein